MTKAIAKQHNPIDKQQSLVRLLDTWAARLQVKPASFNAYLKWTSRFVDFCRINGFSKPTELVVKRFFDEFKAAQSQRRPGQNISPSTVRLALTAVKQFCRFLATEGILNNNIAAWIKAPKVCNSHKRDAIDAKDCKTILDTIDVSSVNGLRNKAILALMMACGLRSVEVVRADVNDIFQDSGDWYLRVQGKGHDEKDAVVKLPKQVRYLIDSYLDKRGDRQGALFKSRKSCNEHRLTTFAVSHIAKAAFRHSGFNSPRLSCHSCRHSAATNALRAGETIEHVQMMLRHNSIVTTFIYRHDLERKDNQVEQAVADSIFGGLS